MSDLVSARIERDYHGGEETDARAALERIPSELSAWKEVGEGDRVELAALTYAHGDLTRLREAVELALHDWRDLLVTVGDA